VFEVGGKRSVFVRTDEGFEAREVRIVAFTDTTAVVEGLEPELEVALLNPNTTTGSNAPQSPPRGAL
jgi:hypothetical protein